MGSLLLSPTTPLQLFAKCPHISTLKTRNHVHKVSCNHSRNSDMKFDRRNLLMGIGGLYGATNLDAPAMADPIVGPDISKCNTATDLNTQRPFPDNCCPPQGDIMDYKPVQPPVTRFRPAANNVTTEFIEKFELAVARMKALPKDDPRNFYQQANVHCAYCNLAYQQTGDPSEKLQIHNCWLFLPWHRWYLYFYERILGKMIDDPTFTFGLPYWNWDNVPPALYIPDMYKKVTSSLYDPRRNPCHLTAMPDLKWHSGTTVRPDQILNSNMTEMQLEFIKTTTLEDFYGKKYSVGSDPDPGPGVVERGSHNALHLWVGEDTIEGFDMGNFATAGRELLFFGHHSNIDRLWEYWKGVDPKNRVFTDPDWLNANFLFYNEDAKLVRVYVGDCLDLQNMGYDFEKVVNPWANSPTKAYKKRAGVAAKIGANIVAPVFPVRLNKVVRAVVSRPKGKRSKAEKLKEEELLVIEGIEVETSAAVRFEVYINDEENKPGELVDKAEYAGCFSLVPHANAGSIKSTVRLALTRLLEELEVEGDEKILVSLVPKAGGKKITVGGIKIAYVNYKNQ